MTSFPHPYAHKMDLKKQLEVASLIAFFSDN